MCQIGILKFSPVCSKALEVEVEEILERLVLDEGQNTSFPSLRIRR
jgi:hypothetical protein